MDCLNRIRFRLAKSGVEQRPPEQAARPGHAPVRDQTVIDFTAFTFTTRITGRLALAADRLTDALNDASSPLVISEVTLVELDSLESETRELLLVSRDDLLIVRGAGPTGSPARRYRTLASEVVLTIGPYSVTGLIHSGPGAHPISGIYHRKTMIPITEAVVSYMVTGRTIEELASTLIVHRDRLTSIRLVQNFPAFRGERPTRSGPRLDETIGPMMLEPSKRAVGRIFSAVSLPADQHLRQQPGESLT
jgi:hypothetical protein